MQSIHFKIDLSCFQSKAPNLHGIKHLCSTIYLKQKKTHDEPRSGVEISAVASQQEVVLDTWTLTPLSNVCKVHEPTKHVWT